MTKIKVGINGFGRIGRLVFRASTLRDDIDVVAINDLTSPKMLAYLLKYDSSQGKYAHADTVEAGEDYITVNGKKITIYKEPDASKLPPICLGNNLISSKFNRSTLKFPPTLLKLTGNSSLPYSFL